MHGVITMGRDRKPGKRKPSGRLVQALENRGGVVAARRTLDHLLHLADNAAMSTVFGRMFLMKKISAAEFNACEKFAVVRAAADRAMGLPARSPKAFSFGAARGLSVEAEDVERVQQAVERLEAAETAVGRRTAALGMLEMVVVHDNAPVTHEGRIAFRDAVQRLVTHWGLS